MAESGADLLARIQPRLDEDWTQICLRPDLLAEHDELEDALETEKADTRPSRMIDRPGYWAEIISEQITANEYLIEEASVRFTFRALTRAEFRSLCDDFPPRMGDVYDQAVGYNREIVSDALVRESLVEPEFDDDSWAQLEAVLSVGEWAEMRRVAEKVNGSVVTESPKSVQASRILARRANDSQPTPASE